MTVIGLHLHEDVKLKNVWTVDTLWLLKRSALSHKDIDDWPHLSGIDFPQIKSDEITLLIGSDGGLNQAKFYDRIRQDNVQWSLNPPDASHSNLGTYDTVHAEDFGSIVQGTGSKL